MNFGRVRHPGYTDRLIPDSQNMAWNNLGPRQPKGVVYHRQVGFNWGTDGHFRTFANARATGNGGLTDYGVERTTGEILRWNDPLGKAHPGCSPNRAGWASGPWESPPGGDGHAFVNKFSVNAINRDLISIEIDGMYGDSIADAALQEIAGLTAYWADQCKIPWDDFPTNPHTGLVFTYWHSEFQNHKPCPGDVVRGLTGQFIERTKRMLQQYQEEDTFADPPTPPAYDGTDKTENGVLYHAEKRTVTVAVDELNCRVKPDPTSQRSRTALRSGQKFPVLYWVTGVRVAGEDRWWVTTRGSHVWAGGTAERPGA